MAIRRFSRDELETEPHDVSFKDLYPWEQIDETPFGASLAIVAPGGRTMLHNHAPAETFVICRGQGAMRINGHVEPVGPGDVIYLPPGSVHDLTNTQTEDLVFVSVFWEAKRTSMAIDKTPRLILPSPPTSNGPLHLGHMAGPYLIADVTARYFKLRGAPATLAILTDDNQSYVADRAHFDGTTPDGIVEKYSVAIVDSLQRLGVTPDSLTSSSRDPAYRAAVTERFARLHREGKVIAAEVETLHCEPCGLELWDSYVAGLCPTCGAECYGSACEACCFTNSGYDLKEPRCDRCNTPASRRLAQRLVFPITPYVAQLVEYHRRVRLSPRLRRLAAQYLAKPLDPMPASQVATWGIPVGIPGFEGQVISPWVEVAVAAGWLREQLVPGGDLLQFFGYDNAFLYLVSDPAISLALDPELALPRGVAANEYLLLDNAKMSTSRQRALDPNDLLAKVPADLLRLYLAKVRPEDVPSNANLMQAHVFLTMMTQSWLTWLARLGGDLAAETGGTVPAPTNSSLVPWSPEQVDFLEVVKELVRRAQTAYDGLSLKEVATVALELAERAAAFGMTQRQLAGLPTLTGERSTALALELVAARCFAALIAPVMPTFGAILWRCLGDTSPVAWPDDLVRPLDAGTTVETQALTSRAFFPAFNLMG
jgi:methionyl-tRNA synthetase